MSYKTGEMEFRLTKPISFAPQGQEVQEFNMISLSEYGPQHSRFYHKVSDMLARMLLEMDRVRGGGGAPEGKTVTDKTEAEHELDSDALAELVTLMAQSSERVDSYEFIEAVRNLVCMKDLELAKIDGSYRMTPHEFNQITPDDQMRLAAEYCAFFTIGCLSRMNAG